MWGSPASEASEKFFWAFGVVAFKKWGGSRSRKGGGGLWPVRGGRRQTQRKP